MKSYEEFLESKHIRAESVGFDASLEALHPKLFDFQRKVVQWALEKGRAAIFAECGLGKTLMQLVWAKRVAQETYGNVLILAPLAVAEQTRKEATRFGIGGVRIDDCQDDVTQHKGCLSIANYEKLHKFDPSYFTGVVLDESSILKSFMGKTKQSLIDSFRNTPFRLCCTATPAPNDYLELGNHAEFLGVMRSCEMIIINSSQKLRLLISVLLTKN